MTKEQIEHIKTELNKLKDECIRILSYFKDMEGSKLVNYDIVPDYCTIITDEDGSSYVYCEELGIGEDGSDQGCVLDTKYLTYTDTQLRDFVYEQNQKYYKMLEEREKKNQNRKPIPIDKAIEILSNTKKTKEEKYAELDKLLNS